MKTSFLIDAGLVLACLWHLCSCDRSLEPLSISRSWFDARYGIQTPADSTIVQVPMNVISCIVSYPDGYDWRRDSLYGDVECRLLLYRDSTLLRSIPAGIRHGISPEADTHFLFGEDLYTIWRDRNSTIIKKNGTVTVSFSPAEIIRGILPSGGSLWTLGTDGLLLRLRKDGETVFERKGAEVYDATGENGTDISGALYLDCDRICFSYCNAGQWHIVCGGEDSVIDTRGAVDKIMKARLVNGTLYVLGDKNGGPGPYLFDGKQTRKLLYYVLDPQSDQRLFTQDGKVFFAGCIHYSSGQVTTEVWDESNQKISVKSDLCYIYSVNGGEGYVALSCKGAAFSPEVEECVYVKAPGLDAAFFDTGHYFSGSRGAAFADGILAVGLTPMGGPPFVWKNGETWSFPVHGYVSTIGFSSANNY